MSSETTKTGNAGLVKIAPVMFAFFVMGFVDLVGTATNYVKAEFNLANGTANLFTTMVFFWFLIFAVPTGMLMNKIGRRKTVLWSILVTLVAMALPIIAYVALSGTARLVLIVISFAFLGIGNTLMQVSLNPLLTVFVKGDKLASTLTLGQFDLVVDSGDLVAQLGWTLDGVLFVFPLGVQHLELVFIVGELFLDGFETLLAEGVVFFF